MEVRDGANAKDVRFYTTDRLREEFHIGNLFTKDNIRMVYSHTDRIIVIGMMPIKLTLKLEPFVLIVGIKADISGKIIYLNMLKIVCLMAIPTKAIRISAVKKIPKIVLLIKGDKIEYLIATAG